MANYIDQFTRPVRIRPTDTALVVVDMQYATGSRQHGLGAHLAREGRLSSADYRFIRIEELLVPNIQKMLAAWRRAKAPVIYIKVGSRMADFSDAPPHLRAFFEVTNNYDGSPENEIIESLRPQPGEHIVSKNTMGAFAGSNLGQVYEQLGIRSAVYVGISTNNCVDTTAREAADRGYGSVLVADATGTCSDRMQEVTLDSFRRLWGRVESSDAVISELFAKANADDAPVLQP
jgi:nicotinamidase-related amidase